MLRPLNISHRQTKTTFTKLLTPQLHYSHTRREGNKVAHDLAQHAINVSNFLAWIEDVPPQLFSVFQANIASLT